VKFGTLTMGFCRRKSCSHNGRWEGGWGTRKSVVGARGCCISVRFDVSLRGGHGGNYVILVREPNLGGDSKDRNG
jgi:hypothetical protein